MPCPLVLDWPLASRLAESFGTPLYVIDEAGFRERLQILRTAAESNSEHASVSYAAKANWARRLLSIAHEEGCTVDASSLGEMEAALRAGVPAARIHLHGTGKTRGDLLRAISVGVGQIIVDSLHESALLCQVQEYGSTEFLVRLRPSVAADTHAKISTAHADSKFGIDIASGEAMHCVRELLAHKVPLVGFHVHVGSMLTRTEDQVSGADALVDFANQAHRHLGYAARVLNFGGGFAARYLGQTEELDVDAHLREVFSRARARLEFEGPIQFAIEPGRYAIAEAGVTLYRVTDRKGNVITVDGGLSDNPSPGFYERKFYVKGSGRGALMKCEVYGNHCETDLLFPTAELPTGTQPGDLLQVMSTGAYNASMASNYNAFCRPAMVLLTPEPQVIQRRETWDDVLNRDL